MTQTNMFQPPNEARAALYRTTASELLALAKRYEALAEEFDTSFYHCNCCGSKRFHRFNENVTAEQLRRWAREMTKAGEKLVRDAEVAT
jgi:hypothetical protein